MQTTTVDQTAGADLAERRASHRHRVLKGGTVLFNGGYASYACQVRNLNDTGALLQFGETTGIPESFDFRLGPVGKTVPAKAIWRTRSHMGIAFLAKED